MDDATGEAVPTGARRPRQGEAFWREMVIAWTTSGLGLRRFCREQGLAVSTFGLWRKKLSSEPRAEPHPLAVTPDAAFIVSHPDAAMLSSVKFALSPWGEPIGHSRARRVAPGPPPRCTRYSARLG
ncbi:IS66 family insertion sequence element accessory protein TnpA [Paraburkholderia aspalathi]|uniref:Transposase n=1 Tax=Paraburkholderia aspalathi TaxID=1324617 RepID=A0A1I7ERE7_9BURK|nr:hypothetical protein [Paraburkholderia aspalathi]SFU26480.1 hypothetical protein SAMN05192563_105630 [Paraburkholderia aspalathi]